MSNFIREIESKRYGKVLRRQGLYKCDCGKEYIKRLDNNAKSCGCLNYQSINGFKHGLSNTYLYETWSSIKQRCYNRNNKDFKYYGGRGIGLSKEWYNNFELFYNYIIENLGLRPTKQHSIDRIDNNEHYVPGNLKWSTKSEQVNNRRKVLSGAI
jgi:hypothetical protein